jgi:hypothetical protein
MAILNSVYPVESNKETTLYNSVSATATTGHILNTVLTITRGVLSYETNGVIEYLSFGSTIVADGKTTLVDVRRNLTTTLDDFSQISATGIQGVAGVTVVKLVNYHSLYNLKAGVSQPNIFTADQTLDGTNRLYFDDSGTYIYDNGTDLIFASSVQAPVSLTTLANAAGVNDKVGVSVTDTTPGYLTNKINSTGTGIVWTVSNPGANEVYQADLNLADTDAFINITAGVADAGKAILTDANGLIDLSFLSPSFSEIGVANESIASVGMALGYEGSTRLQKTDADELNKIFLFAGIGRQTAGAAGDPVNYVPPGPIATVPAFSLSQRADCRLWVGQTQTSSNVSTDEQQDANNWRGQTFTPTAGQDNIARFSAWLTKEGSPTGTVTCGIYALVAGLPSGAALVTATLAATAVATGKNTFTFASPTALTPGTQYGVSVSIAGGTLNSTNNIAWDYQNTDVYVTGNSLTSTNGGGTWTAQATFDRKFEVEYRGIAGEPVFIGNTPGAVVLTPGTYNQIIGYAISTTEIVLNLERPVVFGTFTGSYTASSSVDTEVQTGFKARLIFWASSINTSQIVQSTGLQVTGPGGGIKTATAHRAVQATGPVTTYPPVTQSQGVESSISGLGSVASDNAKYTASVQAQGPSSITFRRVVGAGSVVGTFQTDFIAIG